MATSPVEHPKVVSRAEWLAARREHLKREKELTRAYDELARQRRELPWMKVEKNYVTLWFPPLLATISSAIGRPDAFWTNCDLPVRTLND